MKYINKQWYSIIISLLLIGFLLLVTISVYNLVLKEYNDNKWLWDSIKAFAWAESSQELALLKIKERWYGIWKKIEHKISTWSIVLADDITNTWSFNNNKDVFISYDLNVLADYDSILGYNYSDTLTSNQYSIIPLFYEEESRAIENVSNYTLNLNNNSNIVWNIIAWQEWIWWDGSNTIAWNGKSINASWEADLISKNVSNFLPKNSAYLILFNSGISDSQFTISSNDKFSKPKTEILSSAQVWNYKHNLETKYDNTQFLNMLKYAVFSN